MPAAERDIIDFRGERGRHERFVGREDVLAALDACLVGPGAARGWVLVTGQPGMGKSALLTRWLDLAEQGGRPAPHHFVRRGVADWDRPEAIARSLAAQIERLYPAQADPEARPEGRLLDLIGRVSREVLAPRGERLVLVADGLDEAAAAPGQNPLPLFLPYALPPGVMVLCGSRPTYPHLGWLEGRDGFLQSVDLDAPRWTGSNEAVCGALWEAWAPAFVPPLAPGFVEEALGAGAGNVLYAVKLREWLSAQPAGERRVSRLPRGLRGLLEQAWADLRNLPRETRDAAMSGLGVVCAASEALPRSAIEAAAGWESGEAWEEFLGAVRPFLLEEPEHWAGAAAFRPYHESLRELVAEKVGAKGMREHHRRLLATVAAWPAAEGDESGKRYAVKHAVGHAVAAGEKEKARELCQDMELLEGWCREGGVEAIEEGLREAGEALGDEVALIHKVVRAESHWLRVDPGAMGELVYNRLRSAGWEAGRVRAGLRWGDRLPAYRLRHPVRMGWERTLMGHRNGVNACAVTPDGRRVVSASSDKTLRVWDLESGRPLLTLEGHADFVRACAVTPDGRRVVSASRDGTLRVWDLESGRPLATLEGHTGEVEACAVTADGRRAVSASDDTTLRVWDLESGRSLATFEGHSGEVWACAVTPDGGRIVSASDDKSLGVWDLSNGRLLATLRGHTQPVAGCAVTPDGRRVVSASWDRTLSVWDLASGRRLASLEGHTGCVEGCAVTPDGRHVISGARDNTLRVWDLESGRLLATLEGHAGWVMGCAAIPDGRHVVSASDDKTLKVWDLESGRRGATFEGHTREVTGCTVTPDRRRIVSASRDETVKVWDSESGRLLATLESRPGVLGGCAVTPDGGRIVSASDDKTLRVWDLATGRPLSTLTGHTSKVARCAVTPDGHRIVSASWDQTLKVWDLESGRPLATLTGHDNFVTGCAVTPDGRRVVSASWDQTLKVWDLESGRPLATLAGHGGFVTECAVTPDGRRVVSASWDRTLKVWDLESGRPLATLDGHTDWVTGCAVTPDGRRVVSASEDHTLKVWDLDTGQCLATLHGLGDFTCVAAARDLLCAGDAAGNLWILETPWSTPTPSPTMPTPLKLFYSYAHKDEALREDLETHLSILKRQGLIEPWHDRGIPAGGDWAGDISEHLESADVILLLVSANFLASNYIWDKELARAMQRHEAGEATVIPVFIKPCEWTGTPFGKIQGLPRDARPVTSWPDRDDAWTDVARGIRRTIEQIGARRTGSPATSTAHPASPPAARPAPPVAQAAPTPVLSAAGTPPTRPAVRKLLGAVLRTDADFDAFCMDHFPETHQRFTAGMDRVQKTNHLLQLQEAAAILAKLREHDAAAVARHEGS